MSSLMLFSCNEVSKKTDEKPKDDFKYMSEQFADIKIMRYQVPGFEQLSLQQKELIYYLSEAAKAGRDIIFDQNGNLSLSADPKEVWAQRHPEFFPVNINSASKYELLRVPGLGPTSVNRILKARKNAHFIDGFAALQSLCVRLRPVTSHYLRFS